MSSVADILARAADLIEPEGAWTQGDYEDWRDGRACWCAVGAIGAAGFSNDYDAADNWIDVHPEIFGARGYELARWNDVPERTQAEVVAKLREAAAKARENAL